MIKLDQNVDFSTKLLRGNQIPEVDDDPHKTNLLVQGGMIPDQRLRYHSNSNLDQGMSRLNVKIQQRRNSDGLKVHLECASVKASNTAR